MPPTPTVGTIAERTEGRLLVGDRDAPVARLADPDRAGSDDVVVALTRGAAEQLADREVALLVLSAVDADRTAVRCRARALLAVADPRWALARISTLFASPRPDPGRHPSAVIDPTAQVDPQASVGPFVVVGARAVVSRGVVLRAGVHLGDDAVVEDDAVLHDHVVVGARCRIGPRCVLHPGAVVGADGFGFASRSATEHERIEQLGDVVLEADVEIGAHTCVDRATLGTTRVARGTKVDNLVQLGHNVDVGPGCILVAQSGIAGSSTLGAGTIVAAQAGVAGHLRVGEGARILGRAGVREDVPPGAEVVGTPARPKSRAFRSWVRLEQLDALWRRVRALERRQDEGDRE